MRAETSHVDASEHTYCSPRPSWPSRSRQPRSASWWVPTRWRRSRVAPAAGSGEHVGHGSGRPASPPTCRRSASRLGSASPGASATIAPGHGSTGQQRGDRRRPPPRRPARGPRLGPGGTASHAVASAARHGRTPLGQTRRRDRGRCARRFRVEPRCRRRRSGHVGGGQRRGIGVRRRHVAQQDRLTTREDPNGRHL